MIYVQECFAMSSSTSFMDSCIISNSLGHFSLFLCMLWASVLTSLIYMRLSSFPNTTYWRDYLFSIVYFWVLALAMKLREPESTWHTWWKIPCELGVSWPGPEGRRDWVGGLCVLLREAFFFFVANASPCPYHWDGQACITITREGNTSCKGQVSWL